MRYVPRTKKDRLALVEAQIQDKITKGYALETYKGLKILTKDEDRHFTLTIYKDAAAHPIKNYYFRTVEQRAKSIQDSKESYDYREKYKAELKANPKKSSAANCAGAIREELSKVFPGVKFSVTSDNFAGGNSVDIRWADGPLTKQVEEVTDKYQYGHFNGMEDLYEYSNSREDIPQAKYVHTSRKMSEATRAIIEASAEELYQANPERFENYESSGCHGSGNFAYRVFQHTALPVGAKILGIRRNEKTSGVCQPEQFYYVAYEEPEQAQTKSEKQEIEKVEVQPGKVQIIEYGRGIAVIGDTKPIKDLLKTLGGRFNFRLTCGPGWVFKRSDLERVTEALKKKVEGKTIDGKEALREEIKKTVEWFAESDLQTHGFVTELTKEVAEIQKVSLPETGTPEANKLQIARQTVNMPEAIAAVMGGPTIEEAKETVKHYDNLEDLEKAANSGEVIDLTNLYSLVKKEKQEPVNAWGQTSSQARGQAQQRRMDKAAKSHAAARRRGNNTATYY